MENNGNELDNIVILTDADGNDIQFEFLDIVKTGNREYVILLPLDAAEDGEVAILRVEGNGEYESYVGVETEEETQKVFDLFKEQAKDDFNFI